MSIQGLERVRIRMEQVEATMQAVIDSTNRSIDEIERLLQKHEDRLDYVEACMKANRVFNLGP